MLLDIIDGIDMEAPKWHYLLALGGICLEIRRELGATDRIPEDRLHTNDEQVLDLAFKRLKIP